MPVIAERWLLYIIMLFRETGCYISATRQEKQLRLQQCSYKFGMDLKLIIHRTITISGKRSLVIDQGFKRLLFWCADNSQCHFHTAIYRSEDLENGQQQFAKCQNSVEIDMHQKVHLEFLIKVHILEILES